MIISSTTLTLKNGVFDERPKSIKEGLILFVCDECEVRMHNVMIPQKTAWGKEKRGPNAAFGPHGLLRFGDSEIRLSF
ncbi:hypothetical protein A3F45_00685 [Candidatus Curtissbacteria bacterium RIFCSPHIGHO2_12_FULL_41_17]|uniref:Uncharacterized protein n=1 Tax=Candidatus Curtissbacteria bacterium RIFCSPHIGHO2_12_FULL_41_17 TaxID=1797722 RepID=A0A1F5HKW8_9BACT|nr:MAG: hypothetical protein A3F45_00685 [Candidatus Curtissbacteria bacterium RIFCSPHIGHO2_12_FULL_41_17]